MAIEAVRVSKSFGSFKALKNVSLTVPTGKLVSLLGPSGSGKTTLLRIIAGLEQADAGEIRFDGRPVGDASARTRGVGFVFQHYALFRHMSVFENVAFGLRVKPRAVRPPPADIRRRVMDLLRLVQIDWLADRLPNQLSGGQRQRVALARALAVEPRVLLLDEPFGALDAKVRKELRRWLRRLHDEIQVTSVFVTHDVEEALEVSDEVVVMNEGRIEQHGTPDAVYSHPANAFVYRFLGSVNLFHARFDQGRVALEKQDPLSAADAAPLLAYARPHDLDLSREPGPAPALEADVVFVQAVGPLARVELRRCDDHSTIEAELPRDRAAALALAPGDRVFVRPHRLRVFTDPPAAAPPPAASP